MSTDNLDKKAMLFGNTPMEKEAKTTVSLKSSRPPPKTNKKPHTNLSPALCEKKIAEGNDLHERALKHLKTSLFQWSPDHVAAASTFAAAGKCYNSAGELEKAEEMFLLSAESHDKAGAAAASAQALLDASKVSKARGDYQATAEYFQRASVMWGVRGDPTKAGELLLKAAKELEIIDPARSQELYLQGLEHLCPEDTPEDDMTSCPAIAPEAFRQCFSFYLTVRSSSPNAPADSIRIPTDDIVGFCHRMVKMYAGLGLDASKCRMLLTITLLQLEIGDVVAADRTFMDNLNDSDYLKSNECAAAEEFVMAFKNLDFDRLESAQRSHHLLHLDRDVQKLARELSLLRGHTVANEETADTVATSKNASLKNADNNDSMLNPEKDVSVSLNELDLDGDVKENDVTNNNDNDEEEDDDDDEIDLT